VPARKGWASPLSFTGEEGTADTVSDEYDFLARKLHSSQGRWISPDPLGLGAANPGNPQSWNRYTYVLNNPLSLIDPDGLDCVYLNDNGDAPESIDHGSNAGECWGNGGYWADGFVAGFSSVRTFSNSNNVIIASNYNGFLAQTLAGSSNNGGAAFSQMFSAVATNHDSWGWTFTKSFFGGFASSTGWKAVYNSFGEGGCDRLMFETLGGDFVPYPTEDTPGPADAVEPTAKLLSAATYNRALNYAGSRGLSYAFKSSTFRGIMDASEAIEANVPAATLAVATGHAVVKTALAAANGECH